MVSDLKKTRPGKALSASAPAEQDPDTVCNLLQLAS